MSGLDTRFIPLGQIQEQFWDKLTDAPLANGVLYFWSDPECTVEKIVYVLTGGPTDFSYIPFGTTVTLSSIGTTDDGSGNNYTPYLYPYAGTLAENTGIVELYYITVYNSVGQYQFTAQAVPNIATGSSPSVAGNNTNFITNGQFLLHNTIANDGKILAESTNVAYGGWQYIRSSNAAEDYVKFNRFNSPISNPTGNPRYDCEIKCLTPGADAEKILQVRFDDVNRFSVVGSQKLSLFFSGKNNLAGEQEISVKLYKYYGSGGSGFDIIPIGDPIFSPTYQNFLYAFDYGSNMDKSIGLTNNDYFAIQIILPPTAIFDVRVTDFVLYLGEVNIESYPLAPNPLIPSSIPYQNAVLTTDPAGDITWEASPAENSLLTCDTVGNISWQDTLPANITIGPGLVADPVTSSAATIDTALLHLYNHVLSSYDVYLANPVTLATNTDNYQTITGMFLALPVGTYLINYSAAVRISDVDSSATNRAWLCLYNTTTPGIVVNTEVVAASVYNDRCASSGVGSVILTVTVPTTIQMQAAIEFHQYFNFFVVETAIITAVCLSHNG